MMNEESVRRLAIERYLAKEAPEAIFKSLGRAKSWFFKWLGRYKTGAAEWYQNIPRRHHSDPQRTDKEIEEVIKHVRLELYNAGLFCGAQAIRWRMEELCVEPLPSPRTICRVLVRHNLTHRRTGHYVPKGVFYPKPEVHFPNDVHQTDFVGPCYLQGGFRFYSLHSVDLATGRCAVEPITTGRGSTIPAFWAIWRRLGLPRYQQVDNEMSFYGSPTHPRGMGKLIRLCLMYGIEPVFIPMKEPWRNGVVEKFNDHWRTKFMNRVHMNAEVDLRRESRGFEESHNSRWRYSKLKGKTPLEALAQVHAKIRFPPMPHPPEAPLPKPQKGKYHVIRLIRSDGFLNLFGERFRVPTDVVYEYVWATVDVEKQRLYLYSGDELFQEQEYRLR